MVRLAHHVTGRNSNLGGTHPPICRDPPTALQRRAADPVLAACSVRSGASRLFGNVQHASPLAIDLLMGTIVQKHYAAYNVVAAAVRAGGGSGGGGGGGGGGGLYSGDGGSGSGGGGVPELALWQQAQREIASLWWYHANLVPYSRGSLTTGVLLHHALWLALLPEARHEAALICIPPFRRDMLMDFEAVSVPRLEDWVDGVYWGLFEGDAKDMLGCLAAEHRASSVFKVAVTVDGDLGLY